MLRKDLDRAIRDCRGLTTIAIGCSTSSAASERLQEVRMMLDRAEQMLTASRLYEARNLLNTAGGRIIDEKCRLPRNQFWWIENQRRPKGLASLSEVRPLNSRARAA